MFPFFLTNLYSKIYKSVAFLKSIISQKQTNLKCCYGKCDIKLYLINMCNSNNALFQLCTPIDNDFVYIIFAGVDMSQLPGRHRHVCDR